jgi:glucose 1-dehydrogenase
MELQNKVAIVTGGGVRVGRALVLALAQAGCDVLIHYGRSDQGAKQTLAEIEAVYGRRGAIYSADLASATAPQAIVNEAVAKLGKVDILINSAAIFPDEDTFENTDADGFDTLMHVNLRAPYLLSRAFAEAVGDGVGKIINITDARIFTVDVDHFIYRLTKLSLNTLTKMAALELAPNITVNALALGAILPPPNKDQSYLDHLAEQKVPLKRAGHAEIVAENVLHLLRQDFLTGVTIPLDGGQFLA